jgi:hypothetical protein
MGISSLQLPSLACCGIFGRAAVPLAHWQPLMLLGCHSRCVARNTFDLKYSAVRFLEDAVRKSGVGRSIPRFCGSCMQVTRTKDGCVHVVAS